MPAARRALPFPALLLAALLPWLAGAQELDWGSVADVDTVRVLTENENGTRRDTTVWLVVVDGQGFIRTGGTTWGENVVRDPDIDLRIGDQTWPVTASFVEDEGLRQGIRDAFREKYGYTDAFMSLFRGDRPLIMRLTPR